MAHPLAKVFTWIKSLRHIPLFILACFSLAHFLRLWLGDHPLIYQILNTCFNLKQLFVLCLILWWNAQWSFLFQFGRIGFGRGVGLNGSRCPPLAKTTSTSDKGIWRSLNTLFCGRTTFMLLRAPPFSISLNTFLAWNLASLRSNCLILMSSSILVHNHITQQRNW